MKKAILIVYVDDSIVTGGNIETVKLLKRNLASELKIKNHGHVRYFLGMEVAWSWEGIVICQRKYISDLLKEIGLLRWLVENPMDPTKKVCNGEEQTPVDKEMYQ